MNYSSGKRDSNAMVMVRADRQRRHFVCFQIAANLMLVPLSMRVFNIASMCSPSLANILGPPFLPPASEAQN